VTGLPIEPDHRAPHRPSHQEDFEEDSARLPQHRYEEYRAILTRRRDRFLGMSAPGLVAHHAVRLPPDMPQVLGS
jgi:hypothetical protein